MTQRQWDVRSAGNLKGVHPDLVRVMTAALQAAPFPFRVIDGLRTLDEQKELVRTKKSKTMRSRHLTGHAVDLVPWQDLDKDGKVETEEIFNAAQMRLLAPVIKAAAAKLGVAIEWGGDWRTFYDGPHWQLTWAAYP